jgi:hypothetical protein
MDSFVWLAPLLLLPVIALLGFVGCDVVFGLDYVPPAAEDVAFVQVAVDHVDLGPVTNVTANFTAPLTQGNLVVVWIWFHTSSGQTITGVSDAAGNVYTPADTLKAGSGQLATGRQQVWFAANVAATSGPLMVTFSGPVEPSIGVGAFEYANASTAPLVSAAAGIGNGPTAQNPDVTTTGARMLFGAVLRRGHQRPGSRAAPHPARQRGRGLPGGHAAPAHQRAGGEPREPGLGRAAGRVQVAR